ncbi:MULTISPECIES: hypothetical protein [Bacillus]|uniref:hypothetical protein n=1 Tax=Bacillus TaxID=1386 RepID=UPI000C78F2B0|nr:MULTISPECIES: hypothetical protein [Bacillus]PLR85827.1 hypothetical protein CVD23_07790 [Bacillus sp. V33-4]RSK46949.1 hypothetical protein EJA13_18885 [Bacillus canaveralius]
MGKKEMYKCCEHDDDLVAITTGPFHLPLEADSEIQVGRDNDRVIITLKNPTDMKLKACVTLGVCLQPELEKSTTNQTRVFANIPEKEINLGAHVLKPHTCTRIERNIPGAIGTGKDETNAVYRVTAKGDFMVCHNSCQPICGLLEISVVGGSIFNPEEPGLEQADPVTFFRYKDFVYCATIKK